MEYAKLNEDEETLIKALRESPSLMECIMEMIEFRLETKKVIDNGDEAEEAVVEAIQKTGKQLLKEWADQKSKESTHEYLRKKDYRPHEKKS